MILVLSSSRGAITFVHCNGSMLSPSKSARSHNPPQTSVTFLQLKLELNRRKQKQPSLSVSNMATMSKPFCVSNAGVLNSSSSPSPPIFQFLRRFAYNPIRFRRRNFTIKMSSQPLPPLPESRIVVGCGMTAVDFLVTVDSFPKPDDKVRTTSFKVQGGGNAGNTLTCAARLGLKPRLISKVADDAQGRGILKELEADGVDTSFLAVSKGGSSTFSYVLVDSQTKTRTCIYTPGNPPMIPDDLSQSTLLSAFDEARLVYFDGMSMETLFVAQQAARSGIPILVGAESPREGLDELLKLADFAVCSAGFPQEWTQAPSVPSALVSMILRLPNIKFVIVTLGEDGCLMLERSADEGADTEERDVESFLEFLYEGKDDSLAVPTCISSVVTKLRAKGIGTVCGRFFIGTAKKIPASELIDTTGAGDAFIGAILYAICANMLPEKMLPFAAQVAAANCRALGARTGLPHRTDPCLAPFLR